MNKYLLGIILCFSQFHCKGQFQKCDFISGPNINIIDSTKALCDTLITLHKYDLELYIHVDKDFPSLLEQEKLFKSRKNKLANYAMVFIDPDDDKFHIFFSDHLKRKENLERRFQFITDIRENTVDRKTANFYLNIIYCFRNKFSIHGRI